jgi:uncharacterized membrane protein YhaH (DUF805 family)
MIQCKCPACDKAYNVKDEMGGRYAKCACGNRFLIPQGAEAAPQPVMEAPVPIAIPTVTAPPKAPEPVVAATPPASVKPATVAAPRPPQPVSVMPGARAAKADEGYGGLGRKTFILTVVVVSVVTLVLGYMARQSMGMTRMILAAIGGFLPIVPMLVVTQGRLLNIGYNEWLALGLPVMIGHCAILPEGYKDSLRKDPEVKKQATMMMVKAVLIDVAFYAVLAGMLVLIVKS